MNGRELRVHMDGTACGSLVQDRSGNLTFTYDDAYRAAPDATPLSLSMPLAFASHSKRQVRPYFDNLLPDSVTAREALAHTFAANPRNPFSLLEHMGADVAGALQILPPGAAPSDAQPGGHRLLQPAELGDALRSVVEEYRDGRGVGAAAGRFSLAGAQPKLALFRTENGAWAVPDGGTPTTHILKPVAGGYRRLDVTEFLTMRAAGHLGLDVAETQLVNFDGQPCFVTQRYDREFSGGTWHRLHQEDLCQALAVPPDKKHQRQDGGPGVAECARLLNQLPDPADRSKTAMAFFQWLAFNVVCEGTDAHAKNFSLLLQGHRVSPAPLYDLLTYAPYRGDGETTYSAMKVGGEYRFSAISDKALVATARTLRLDPGWAESTLRAIQAGAVGAFEQARAELVENDAGAVQFADHVLASVRALRATGRQP